MAIYLVLGAALAVLSIAIVCYPFLKARSGSRSVELSEPGNPSLGSMADAEMPDRWYDAIRTLQLEYQLGKVPEETYQEQLREYRLRAAAALRQQIESAEAAEESFPGRTVPPLVADRFLEQEILAVRAALFGGNGLSQACPSCGGSVGPEVSECPWCHARLTLPGPGASRVSAP